MANIFYVSSWGGSATEWLTRALALHPQISCIHGQRGLPAPDGELSAAQQAEWSEVQTELSPEAFAGGLIAMTAPDRFCGAVHGFHGLEMKEPVERYGGRFAMIVRHPLFRVSSLYRHYLDRMQGPDRPAVEEMIRFWSGRQAQLIALLEQGTKKRLGLEELIFAWLVASTRSTDAAAFGLPPEQVYRMEDFTREPEVFAAMARHLTRDALPIDQEYLDRVRGLAPTNVHRRRALSEGEQFLALSQVEQVVFLVLMEPNLDGYQALGYDMGNYALG